MRKIEDSKGIFLKEFKNVGEALDYLKEQDPDRTWIEAKHIFESINTEKNKKKRKRKSKSFAGFAWEFKDEEEIKQTVNIEYGCDPNRRVIEMDKSGNLIMCYSSIDAAAKAHNRSRQWITRRCSGANQSTNLIFKFAEPSKRRKSKPGPQKAWYAQYSLEGKFVEKFPSIRQAAEKVFQINPNSSLPSIRIAISKCAGEKGRPKSCMNFQWKKFELNVPISMAISPYIYLALNETKTSKLKRLEI